MNNPTLKRHIKQFKLTWQLYVMILIPFAMIITFHYVPMYGIQIAFREFRPTIGITDGEWIGFEYIARYISSAMFVNQLTNTLLINIYGMVFSFPLPIIFALALNYVKAPRYKKMVQTITYAPHFISTVIIVSLLKQLFNPSYGIVNEVIVFFGGSRINFFGEPAWFRPLYIGSGIWQGLGWNSIIYLSALSSIDPQLHEAAKIDGANILRRIWHVDIPGILPTVIILLIMSFAGFMSVGFEKVYMMQSDLNLEVSETINTYVYKVGMVNSNYSFSTAIGLFQSVVGFILIVTVNWISKRVTETSLW